MNKNSQQGLDEVEKRIVELSKEQGFQAESSNLIEGSTIGDRRWRFQDKGSRCSPPEGLSDTQSLEYFNSLKSCSERHREAYFALMRSSVYIVVEIDGFRYWPPVKDIFFPGDLEEERIPNLDEPVNLETALAEAKAVDRGSLFDVARVLEKLQNMARGEHVKFFYKFVSRGELDKDQSHEVLLLRLDQLIKELSA